MQVGPRRLWAADLTVVHRGTPHHDYGYDPGGVLLVVEVVSPSSVTLHVDTAELVMPHQR